MGGKAPANVVLETLAGLCFCLCETRNALYVCKRARGPVCEARAHRWSVHENVDARTWQTVTFVVSTDAYLARADRYADCPPVAPLEASERYSVSTMIGKVADICIRTYVYVEVWVHL